MEEIIKEQKIIQILIDNKILYILTNKGKIYRDENGRWFEIRTDNIIKNDY